MTTGKETMKCIQIAEGLYLHVGEAMKGKAAPPAKPPPTHHCVCVDVSGSMGGELPKLVKHLENKLPSLLDPGDFFSLIWFSGRKEAGAVFDHISVQSLKDIAKIQKTLAKWLRPIGMTGFVEPAKLATDLFRLSHKERKNLLFMSDGCENQNAASDVYGAFAALGAEADAATVVEYGFYADRKMLGKLAELSGGSTVLSRDFESYEIVFERSLKNNSPKERFVDEETGVGVEAIEDKIVFVLDEPQRTIRIFQVADDGRVCVPEGCTFAFVSSRLSERGEIAYTPLLAHLYAALAVFGHRMRGPLVRKMILTAGDADLLDKFSRCFGKQRYADFVDEATAVSFDGASGRKFSAVAVLDKDAMTVPELLDLLLVSEHTRFLRDDPRFAYTRMSRGREDASGLGLTFTRDPAPDGVPIHGLTKNEERPNLSILTQQTGEADLSTLPNHQVFGIPTKLRTKVYRNYNVVKDGIVHIDLLPVTVPEVVYDAIQKRSKKVVRSVEKEQDRYKLLLDLSCLGVTNWDAVEKISARDFFLDEWDLHVARSNQKVYRFLLDELDADRKIKASNLAKLYGEEGALWLKSVGITDNGYQPPHTKQAESTDCYFSKSLVVKMKGLSSLPTVKEVREQLGKNKVSPKGWAMGEAIVLADAARVKKPAAFQASLEDLLATEVSRVRRALSRKAGGVFALITGQVWFSDFSSLSENSLTLGKKEGLPFDVEFTATLEEKEIPI